MQIKPNVYPFFTGQDGQTKILSKLYAHGYLL